MDDNQETLLQLKRNYSKDELLRQLHKQNAELQQEIGMLKSELAECKHDKEHYHNKYEKLFSADEALKERVKESTIYKRMKDEVKSLREQNRKLKINNDILSQKLHT